MPNAEHREGREGAPRPEQVLAEILKSREQRYAPEAEGGEWFASNDSFHQLPQEGQADVRAYDAKLAAKGLEPEDRREFVEDRIQSFSKAFVEQRFRVGDGEAIFKESYAKKKAVDRIDEILDADPTVEDLKRVARMSFDANGLKAVNDLSASHEKGTEYLRRIADVIHNPKHPARARLDEMGVTEFLAVTGGGDEYGVLVKGDKPLDATELAEVVRMYADSIEAIDVSDLVDFSEQATKLRYLGISEREFAAMPEDAKKEALAKFDDDMPEGFVMRASASGGAATLYDGFARAISDPRENKRLTGREPHPRALDRMMGGLWDAADSVAEQDKTGYKNALAASESPADRFYSKVLKRTTEARVLEERIEGMSKQVETAARMQQEIAALMAIDGLDAEAKMKAMGEIVARYSR